MNSFLSHLSRFLTLLWRKFDMAFKGFPCFVLDVLIIPPLLTGFLFLILWAVGKFAFLCGLPESSSGVGASPILAGIIIVGISMIVGAFITVVVLTVRSIAKTWWESK